MTSIDFVLSPESTVRFYDVILCLARFGENVGVEANREKVEPPHDLNATGLLMIQ